MLPIVVVSVLAFPISHRFMQAASRCPSPGPAAADNADPLVPADAAHEVAAFLRRRRWLGMERELHPLVEDGRFSRAAAARTLALIHLRILLAIASSKKSGLPRFSSQG